MKNREKKKKKKKEACPYFIPCTEVNSKWIRKKKKKNGTSLAVHWLRLCTSKTGGVGSIPVGGTKMPHAVQGSQKRKKKKKWIDLNVRAKIVKLLEKKNWRKS